MPRASWPAILLVSIGAAAGRNTSVLLGFGKKVEAAFSACALAWVFTTPHTEKKRPLFRGEQGLSINNALARLVAENHLRIAVQPLNLVDGLEHAALCRELETWRLKHPQITISLGAPLLTDEVSMHTTLEVMRLAGPPFPGEAHDPEEAVIWVGHGSDPPHDEAYRQLATLADAQTPRQYVGCGTGRPTFDDTLSILTADGWEKVCLMPLFTLAGYHAANDLGGNGPGSWKFRLDQAGIRNRVRLRGMLEHEAFAAMWLNRLRKALQNLDPV